MPTSIAAATGRRTAKILRCSYPLICVQLRERNGDKILDEKNIATIFGPCITCDVRAISSAWPIRRSADFVTSTPCTSQDSYMVLTEG